MPRLELCGLVVLSNLMATVATTVKSTIESTFAHCDSAIVLYWIKKQPSAHKPFTAHRIQEIQQLTQHVKFRHVWSEDNPADLISRGLLPEDLIGNLQWWDGPEFLMDDEANWPVPMVSIDPEDKAVSQELKPLQVYLVSSNQNENQFIKMIESISSLQVALRKFTAISRACYNFRSKKFQRERLVGPHGPKDYHETMLVLIRSYQAIHFKSEIELLQKGGNVSKQSKLKKLAPQWDAKDRVIRVGGRLENVESIDFNQQHQIVIPKCHLARLIIRNTHQTNMHCGQQATLGHLMMKYWILDARNTIRHEIHKCMICFRSRPKMMTQFMGQLPQARATPSPPFAVTGVDYAGPLMMKVGAIRSPKMQKCYVAVFVCFSTKAIHLELITDLTTKAFMGALDRFESRRGLCSHMHSDNGTNFVGAAHQLRDLYDFLKKEDTQKEIHNTLAEQGTQWHFIPPKAPEHGGLWEAGVKSMKHHLTRVTQKACFTYEELSTVLCRIEAVLNSRPLMPLSCDPNDVQPLTPGHFLIGRPLKATPEHDVTDVPMTRLQRWDRVTLVQQQFWKRWTREYLHSLQMRQKNFKRMDVKPGQLVLVKDEATPSLKWPLARIHRTIPGKDGIVRAVELKTAKGFLLRPITQLALLPGQGEERSLGPQHVAS
jgi:Family of unknown function (DUF5641)/Integrase zinc binding domain